MTDVLIKEKGYTDPKGEKCLVMTEAGIRVMHIQAKEH